MAKPLQQHISFIDFLPLCKDLGISVLDVEPGEVTCQLPYSDRLIGDPETGVIHGGAVSILLDSTCGLAVMSHPENNGETATIDLRIDYMRPAITRANIFARASVYQTTRKVAFLRAIAWAEDEAKPVAQATGAFVFKKKGADK